MCYEKIIKFKRERDFSNKLGSYDLNEQCDPSGCMTELGIQLAIIMVGKQVLNNFQEIFFPIILNWLGKCLKQNKSKSKITPSNLNQASNDKTTLSQWVNDLNLMKWTHLTLFDEYLEMSNRLFYILRLKLK
jgi:hypothetical protein